MIIKLGIYGIKEASILEYDQLVKHLKTRGYYPAISTNEIFSDKTWKKYTSVCRLFWVKYHSADNADHILNTFKDKYAITTNW